MAAGLTALLLVGTAAATKQPNTESILRENEEPNIEWKTREPFSRSVTELLSLKTDMLQKVLHLGLDKQNQIEGFSQCDKQLCTMYNSDKLYLISSFNLPVPAVPRSDGGLLAYRDEHDRVAAGGAGQGGGDGREN